jgi:hypothetical protein
MNDRFDELAKSLAEGVPRREALRRLGGGLLTAMLASLGLENAWGQGGGGGSFTKCSTYCNTLPRPQRSNCNSACRQCGGNTSNLCPSKDSDKVTCCSQGQVCCGGVCCSSANCVGQVCALCPQGQALCGATCCPLTQVCCNGVCCGPGQTCISGMCQAQPTCLADGSQCNTNTPPCCSGNCASGVCQANPNCQPTNATCQMNSDCCSQNCDANNHVCV